MLSKDFEEVLIEIAFSLTLKDGWKAFSLNQLAEEVGEKTAMSPILVSNHYPAKSAILSTFERYIDAQVLAEEIHFTDQDTPRDRIFEVLMLRLEMIQKYKTALSRICKELPLDPLSIFATGPTLLLSMSKMLNASGQLKNGLLGVAQAHGLLAIWASSFRTWLTDNNPDHSLTMAKLDRNLRYGENIIRRFPKPITCRLNK